MEQEYIYNFCDICFCPLLYITEALIPTKIKKKNCKIFSQRSSLAVAKLDEDTERDMLAVDILNRNGALSSLLRSQHHLVLRRAPRPASQVPKRAQQGSRFALSLDVPTSILSVLIDLAKNQDMRTKAAANAELMARIGKRK
ncbi:prolyl 4-hydroxylase [Sarotherodon galilaeus]